MEFYGLLGEKLSHSLSPQIHSEILKLIDREGAYKLFEVKEKNLQEFTKALKILKIKGANVTIPYKEEIIKHIDSISKEAERIGAINTIWLKNNKLYGHNTDYYGFGYMLKANDINVEGKRAVILGNGGACKAVLYYLLDNGISNVYIVSRNPDKREFNLENVKVISYDQLEDLRGDIIINSTPIGMYPNIDKTPVCEYVIKNFDVLVDLIYNPTETMFLSIGKSLGKKSIGGLYMLIGQAVKSQEIWQEKEIEEEVIKKIYEKIKLKFI
ncbi:shikimate dehydrogenase [Clostridium sp. MB05]|jgi:shikimate dehydrogenase